LREVPDNALLSICVRSVPGDGIALKMVCIRAATLALPSHIGFGQLLVGPAFLTMARYQRGPRFLLLSAARLESHSLIRTFSDRISTERGHANKNG